MPISWKEDKALYAKEWRRKNEDYIRDKEYKKRFGITLEEYDKMLESQNGVCKTCGKECSRGRLAVDHCHETGKIRGLLCRKCNVILGLMNDDSVLAHKMGEYLASKI